MKDWTVRRRIIAGFSAVIVIMVLLSGFASVLLYEIKDKTSNVVSDTWPGLYLTQEIKALSRDTLASVYRALLTTDADGQRQIQAQIEANRLQMDQLFSEYERTIATAQDRQLFTGMTAARVPCEATYKQAIEKGADSKVRSEDSLRDVESACNAFVKAVDAEVVDNKEAGDESNARILSAVTQAQVAVPVGLLFGFILATISGYVLVQAINKPLSKLVSATDVMRTGNLSQRLTLDRRDEFGVLANGLNLMAADLTSLIGRVQQSSLQVSTSSTEIAATSQEQLSTANEIAATTSEIGATSKQISVTSKELVQTMKEVADVGEKTAALAGSGQEGLARMKTTVQQIVEASGSITDRLAVLSEKAGNIGAVVTTITKVADQTNLLSLNAAIEAEKAGEYGRGFAVVATEIRRLADQTAVSASDIEQTVKEMQSAVAAGVMGMDKFSEEVRRGVESVRQVSEELAQIIQQVQTLTPSFEAVSEGMQSQSLGAQQISESLSQLTEAAKQTVSSLRQSNVAVEQLNDAVRGLQGGVSRFTLQA